MMKRFVQFATAVLAVCLMVLPSAAGAACRVPGACPKPAMAGCCARMRSAGRCPMH